MSSEKTCKLVRDRYPSYSCTTREKIPKSPPPKRCSEHQQECSCCNDQIDAPESDELPQLIENFANFDREAEEPSMMTLTGHTDSFMLLRNSPENLTTSSLLNHVDCGCVESETILDILKNVRDIKTDDMKYVIIAFVTLVLSISFIYFTVIMEAANQRPHRNVY